MQHDFSAYPGAARAENYRQNRPLKQEKIGAKIVIAEHPTLRTQFNPYFLYNALHAISELGYNDPRTADNVVTQLSLLLRKSLDDRHFAEIALRDEMAFLARYLNIQKILLRERLRYQLAFDPDILNARVPSMIIHHRRPDHRHDRRGLGP